MYELLNLSWNFFWLTLSEWPRRKNWTCCLKSTKKYAPSGLLVLLVQSLDPLQSTTIEDEVECGPFDQLIEWFKFNCIIFLNFFWMQLNLNHLNTSPAIIWTIAGDPSPIFYCPFIVLEERDSYVFWTLK